MPEASKWAESRKPTVSDMKKARAQGAQPRIQNRLSGRSSIIRRWPWPPRCRDLPRPRREPELLPDARRAHAAL